MRLTFVISSLTGGGAERALVLLAEGFLKKGHDISVITLYGEDKDFYTLPSKVKRLPLNIANDSPTFFHAIKNNYSRIAILRKTISSEQPDIVISFIKETNILTLLALTNVGIPVIISEQNNPRLDANSGIWDKLRIFTYARANKIVSCSKGVDDYFDWIPRSKRAVIYNPLTPIADDNNNTTLWEKADSEKKLLVAMGRLTYQKGFDILLLAFNKIAHKYPQWQLMILGEGELRQQLENLRDKLGLSHQVTFPGRIKNPFPFLKKSEIFVLSSRYEGFGNVIIEAMACGLPVISTDCPNGPREIINHNLNGILVPTEDVSALASAIEHLITNPEEAAKLAEKAQQTLGRFRLEQILENWQVLINETAKSKKYYVNF
ncbi:MAG: glycosyltransferase family 4 protein [Rivularia sp. T60_A2020_040]|nr:glycosyltransferase family 4 protein [Rivularia sp. T60_A2020_040]